MAPSLEEIVGDFKPGSIRHIKLRNFLTYDSVDFIPGPRLNIVMGPNGTGKSTILNATCLGLGGEPALLGRADDARKFITHGKEKAMIEIKLEPFPGKETHVFRRVIDANKGSERGRGRGASTFFINGEKVTAKEVRSKVSQVYHITVDNLCTFLPQDRVGSFSGFNSQALMHETEKSMSSSNHLYETHMKLIKKEEELANGSNDVETIQAKLKRLEDDNERLEREKERMEEREDAMRQVELLEKKMIWLRYDEARNACLALKEEKEHHKANFQQASEKIAPLQTKHAQLDTRKQQESARCRALDTHMMASVQETEKQATKFETHFDELDVALQDLTMADSEREKARRAAEQQTQRVQSIQDTLAQFPAREELVERMDTASGEVRDLRPSFDKARKELGRASEQLKGLHAEQRTLQEKLQRMNDEKAVRRARIFRQQPNLEKICQWLDQNRTSFRRPVWGPVACEVTTKSENAAAYLEQHVPGATLKSFVVECREDYDLLYREIRTERKVPVNILTVRNGELKPITRMYSEAKYQILRREHGVIGYMDESFTAPDAIMQALRNSASVQHVLVGGEKTQESLDHHELLDYLGQPEEAGKNLMNSCIFSTQRNKSFKYTSMISRYSGKPSVRIDEITPARMLAAGINPSVKQKTEEDLAHLEEKRQDLTARAQQAEGEHLEANRVLQEAKARYDEAKREVETYDKAARKLASSRRKLEDMEKAAASDNTEQKRKLVREIKSRVASCITALENQPASHRRTMDSTYKRAGLRINSDMITAAERKARTLLLDARGTLSELERFVKEATRKLKEKKGVMNKLLARAKEAAPLEDDDGDELPLKGQLENLPVRTTAETQAALEEARSKVDGIDANPDIIRQYKARKKEIEEVKERLAIITDSKGAMTKEIGQILEAWENALDHSVSKVDILFSEYMAELGCAGQIVLRKGGEAQGRQDNNDAEKKGNFKEWGIEIQVKFREKSKFEVLSAQRQSGGERSVSTIMYLMALQDLMVSPFRFVDEINQGLDERNERLVFRRIVKNSTKPPSPSSITSHSGQYFLITPKLLPNLTDMENEAVTVHIITNGPYTFRNPLDWDPVKIAGMKRDAAEGGEDEEDPSAAASVSPTPLVPRKSRPSKKKRRSS